MADDSVTYKSREGAFFKYICTLPIDLEKFQIFNRIDKHACEIIDTDNCVVWALKQAGIDSDTIERINSQIQLSLFDSLDESQRILKERKIV